MQRPGRAMVDHAAADARPGSTLGAAAGLVQQASEGQFCNGLCSEGATLF
jgi:hypothetical protein